MRCCTAPIVSALVGKFGCRSVAASGALIAAFGFAISRFSTSVNGLMITFGLTAGARHIHMFYCFSIRLGFLGFDYAS